MTTGVYIIAEAGVNHNGCLDRAKQLINVAAEAGADAVKFQTFRAEKLVTPTAKAAEYQTLTTGQSTQYQMLKNLELKDSDHLQLLQHSQSCDIQFLSTGFDHDSLYLLNNLGLPLFKVPSGEINNYPLLETIAQFGKPVVVSTGMATLEEIQQCISVLIDNGMRKSQLTILHCNTQYPTPMADVNLRAMQTIQEAFPQIAIGYSDHTLGIEIPVAAVALGAKLIEKHFTLDKQLAGPDHAASLDPAELQAMIAAIRNIEIALGHGKKIPSPSETPNLAVVRKSIVAATPIRSGEVFTSDNLTTRRPATGRSPMDWPDIIGTCAQRDYEINELIE